MSSNLPFVRSVYQPSLTVADLLLRSGDQQADAERRRGEIAAQMWTGLGNTIARVPMQIQDMKTQAIANEGLKTRNAMQANALADQNDVRAGQADVDRMMSPHPLPAGVQGPQEENFLTPDGLNDIPKMNAWLASAGKAHLAPELLKGAETINDSIKKSQEQDQIAAQHKALLYGDLAHGAITLNKTVGMPIAAAMDFVSQAPIASKQLKPEEYAQVRQQIGALPPDQQEAALNTFRDAAAKLDKAKTVGKDTLEVDRYGRTIASNIVPEKPDAAIFAATMNDPNKTPEQRAAAKASLDALQGPARTSEVETARHNAAMESISRMTQGREAAAQAETARHNLVTEKNAAMAANPFGLPAAGSQSSSPTAIPQTQGPTGEEFLKTLQPGIASEVKAYAEGKRPFPTGMSYAKLQPLIQLVSQYDPSFDASNYNARNKVRTDLESPSGTGGKTINALNTALQHAGKLSDLIEKMDNYETPLANTLVNPLRTAFGKTEVTNFKAVAPQLMKEIERAWRGTGGSSADIKDLIDSISSNAGKQQQREALSQFVDLVKGKLDSTAQQRDNALGPVASQGIPILFDQNKPVMDKIAQRASSTSSNEWVRDSDGKLIRK